MVWNINDIRKILKEMDIKTGLNGSALEIKLSSRMTKCMGSFSFTCIRKKDGIEYTNREKPMFFTFSTKLLDGRYEDQVVIDTIQHEYIHYYCAMTYDKVINHGIEFKVNCLKFGVNPSTYFKWDNPKEDVKKPTKCYVLTCVSCKKEYIRKRKCKVVEHINNYRCASCNGKLTCSIEVRNL